MSDKCCGTCKWWDVENKKPVDDKEGIYSSSCFFVIPESVVITALMKNNEGTDCPTWEERNVHL